MTLKPRPISGNLPFDVIAKDYNRYCGRIVGNSIPGGGPSPVVDLPQVVWDPLNKDASITLSNSDRDASGSVAGWKSVRSLTGIAPTETSKVYFELHQPGLATAFQGGIGFADETGLLTNFVGASNLGAMYTPIDGNIYHNGGVVGNIGAGGGSANVINGVFDPVTRGVWFGRLDAVDTSGAAQATLSGTGTVYLTCSSNTSATIGRLSAVPRQWYWRNSANLSDKVAINGAIPTVTKKIVGFGDSITVTAISMALTDRPLHLYQEANGDQSIAAISGVSGRTAVQGDTGYATMVTPLYDAALETTLIVWLGTNDIFFATGQANNATAALASIIAKAKAEGWNNLFIANIIQRGTVDAGHGGSITDWRTDADTINAWITANATDYTEMLMRETDDDYRWETVPFTGNGPNPPYGDNAHPTADGYQLLIPALDAQL